MGVKTGLTYSKHLPPPKLSTSQSVILNRRDSRDNRTSVFYLLPSSDVDLSRKLDRHVAYSSCGEPSLFPLHCKEKMPKIWNKYSQKRNTYRGLSPNFHFDVSVSELYIPTMGLPLLLEEICRLILGIYKSLKDTWMWKLGLRPRYSQKRNI